MQRQAQTKHKMLAVFRQGLLYLYRNCLNYRDTSPNDRISPNSETNN